MAAVDSPKSGHDPAEVGNEIASQVIAINSAGWSFKSGDALAVAGNGTVSQPTLESTITSKHNSAESAAKWESIEITFLSDERVRISNDGCIENRNYAEFGFEDGRTGKPTQAWMILRELAKAGGIIDDAAATRGDWSKMEKRMQEIRKLLRKHFGIPTDPLPYKDGTGYRACFKIGRSPSFNT
jgi:hypothetical protein